MRDFTKYAVYVWSDGGSDRIIVCGADNYVKAVGLYRKIYGDNMQYQVVHMDTGEIVDTNIPANEQ